MFTRIKNYTKAVKNEIIETEREIGVSNTSKLFKISMLDIYLICCEKLGICPKTHEKINKSAIYSEEFKDEVASYATKTTVSTASKLYKVSTSIIRKWVKERNLVVSSKSRYSAEFIDKVVAFAHENTVSEAGKIFEVSFSTVKKWCDNESVSVCKKHNAQNNISEEYKSEVMAYAAKTSIPEAARLYKTSGSNIRNWFKKTGIKAPKRGKHFPPELIDEIVKFSEENGISEASRTYDISYHTIRVWCKEANVDGKVNKCHKYNEISAEKKAAILQDISKLPPREIASKYNIDKQTVTKIREEAGIPAQSIHTYSKERIAELKEYAKMHSVKETAMFFNVPQGSIYYLLKLST